MSEKRKDNAGRILRVGESQRKDLIYQFRYNDPFGKRKTVYAKTLKELREKEKAVEKMISQGGDYVAGNITVADLVKKYLSLKQGVKYNTEVGYNTVWKILTNDPFSRRKIRDIRVSDVQQWFIKLQKEDGRRYSSICNIRGVLRPAFAMAVAEDILPKNPFDFEVTGVIKDDTVKRTALTKEQENAFLSFLKDDPVYKKYYDMIVILLNTGLRVSELCGLTRKDLDFENRVISVSHQLIKQRRGDYYVEKTKTDSGVRLIPMNNETYSAFKSALRNRKKTTKEIMIDGYSGFIFLCKTGYPHPGYNISNIVIRAKEQYNRVHPENKILMLSAHVLRHTFCTRLVAAGMDLKSVQYIMGHSDISTTMDVYAHSDYDHVMEEMCKIYHFSEKAISNNV